MGPCPDKSAKLVRVVYRPLTPTINLGRPNQPALEEIQMKSRSQEFLDKFYPVPASSFSLQSINTLPAVQHAILKWTGALQCEQYALELNPEYAAIFDQSEKCVLPLGGETCALCWSFPCSKCPIMRETGFSCGDPGYSMLGSLFELAQESPQIMLDVLKRIESKLESQNEPQR